MTSAPRLATQRYTANGCTLEITAAESPLSYWSDRSLLKHVRFRLWLQPPDPESEPEYRPAVDGLNQPHLIAQGTQAQLEALAQTVHDYVSSHLSHGTARSKDGSMQVGLTAFWPLGQQHQLTAADSPPLTLGTLELFDVAEALHQYEQSNANLPALTELPSRRTSLPRRSRSTWLWGSSAAAAVLLAVGVTATLRHPSSTDTTAEIAETDGTAVPDKSVTPDSQIARVPSQQTEAAPAPASEPDLTPETEAAETEAARASGADASSPTQPTLSSPSPARSLPRSDARSPSPSAAPAPRPTAQPENSPARPGSASSQPSPPAGAASPTAPTNSSTESAIPRPQPRPSAPGAPRRETDDAAIQGDESDSQLELAETAPVAEAADSELSNTFSSGTPAPTDLAPTLTAVEHYLENQLETLSQVEEPSEQAPEPLTNDRRQTDARLYEMVLNPNGTVASLTPLNSLASQQPIDTPTGAIVAPFERDSALVLRISVMANGQVTVSYSPAQTP